MSKRHVGADVLTMKAELLIVRVWPVVGGGVSDDGFISLSDEFADD
ncbi:hypothetical protein [Alkalihalobacillus sp. AL-G]|nr:hypothetical protein [Alkalihalobacillus sp. AL-G]WLD94103.1 hypothetical protein MOJ78_04175 [Alkalihalobacillus sp. AL-G]